MAAGPSGATTTEQLIVAAQKATNQLKALLANAKPLLASQGASSAGAQRSGSAVDALVSDIADSLSQALASLRLGALDSQPQSGQSSTGGGGGGRSAPRRSGQRVRTDEACRMIVLQNELQDSYTWRKYGQKDIIGARFPRSYFKCGRTPGCPARKQVQKTDADPSKLELIYFDAHTCNDPPSSSSHSVPDPVMISSSTQGNTARLVPVAATVPSGHQHHTGQPSSMLHPVLDLMTIAGSNVPSTTDVLVPPVAVVPAALSCSTSQCDPVREDTTFTSWMEEEHAELLFIPSPACSQSELLSTEAAKAELHGPPEWMDHDVACDGREQNNISDFAVPEL